MYEILYLEIIVICLSILAFILSKLIKKNSDDANILSLELVVFAVMVMLVLNFVWVFIQGNPKPQMFILNYICNVVYLTASCLVSYLWFLHVKSFLNLRYENEKFYFISGLPVLAMFILSLFSINKGWMFTLDASDSYQHGSFYFVAIILFLVYPVLATIKILQSINKNKNDNGAVKNSTLLFFCFFQIIACILNIIFNKMPIEWPCAALCLYIYYVNIQEYSILVDGLTGINNRLCFNEKLQDYINENDDFFLMVMDIDSFKSINDKYGHFEGDIALKKTASILKKIVGKRDLVLARYGGDEFTIIGKTSNEINEEQLKNTIVENFNGYNLSSSKKYNLVLSIGSANFIKDSKTSIKSLIETADKNMYLEKAKHKQNKNVN